MTFKEITQPRKLTIIGFALPYLFIIAFGVIIISMPGTAEVKTEKIGTPAFTLTLIASLIGAILVGGGSVKKERLESSGKSLINAFIFGFFWTAIFHFFITITFIMQIVFIYAGLQH